MGVIGFPEASITNYQSTLLRVPAERRPQQRVYKLLRNSPQLEQEMRKGGEDREKEM